MSSIVFASSAEVFCALADRYNTLNPAQSAALVTQAQSGNRAAAESLVLGHLYVVSLVVSHFCSRLQKADLYHEGVLALHKAIENYDAAKGPFYLHAKQWVRYYMEKAMAEYGYAVRLPEEKVKRMMKLNRLRSRFLQENGFEASSEELSELTGYEKQEVERLLGYEAESIDENHSETDDSFYNPWTTALLSDDAADALFAGEDIALLLNGLADKREAYVVGSLYGVGWPQKEVNELAAELHLTEQRIRQIRQSALGKLRQHQLAA